MCRQLGPYEPLSPDMHAPTFKGAVEKAIECLRALATEHALGGERTDGFDLATGQTLDVLVSNILGLHRTPGESDADLRARALATIDRSQSPAGGPR